MSVPHWNAIETLARRLIREQTVSRDDAAKAALEMETVDLADLAATSSIVRGILGLS
ncbi:MAG TPA: hypothetical protein VKC66_03310 [Xanthobacteraceae bacterium]|nr:hypothetical protein [Xanthobacteraceae bacterium]